MRGAATRRRSRKAGTCPPQGGSMFRRLTTLALALSVALAFALASAAPAAAGARVDPKRDAALARGGEVHAIAFFNHPVTAADKARLLAAGATLAIPYTRWP